MNNRSSQFIMKKMEEEKKSNSEIASELNKSLDEQDFYLNQIGEGLDQLKNVALKINGELNLQQHMLTDIEKKIDINTKKVKTATEKTEQLTRSGICNIL